MKAPIRISCGAALVVSLCCHAALAEDLSCTTKEAFPNGEWTKVELRLQIVDGKVGNLVFDRTVSSGEPGGAYSCHVDTTAEGVNAQWTVKGRTTAVTLPAQANENPSVLRITRSANTYRVSFDGMTRQHCGFGAEYPQAVELSKGAKRCLVHE